MQVFWGRAEVAKFLEVKTDSLNGYQLPDPDAVIGKHRGWDPETIKKWQQDRPGRGNWNGRKSPTHR